ncbi:MAG: FeoB-associated Cys-rich membrane protein [Candidatus Zixiibacteriota bacterium]
METFPWQDVVVYSAITLAAVYLFRRVILPRLRKQGGGGCDKCGAHQALSSRPGVTVQKLSADESARLRNEMEATERPARRTDD